MELRSQNDIEFYVEQVRKKGIIILKAYSLSKFVTFKNEILEEIKNAKYNDLEDMVYGFHLTYEEIIDILDLRYIPTKRIGYSIPPGMYGIVNNNFMLKHSLPNGVKITYSNWRY